MGACLKSATPSGVRTTRYLPVIQEPISIFLFWGFPKISQASLISLDLISCFYLMASLGNLGLCVVREAEERKPLNLYPSLKTIP